MNIIKKMSKFNIGSKLTLGFVLVILASLTISALATLCFFKIQVNSAKRDVTVEMVNALAKARLNRTLFQYTRDNKFIELNGEAMNQLSALHKSLEKYSWSTEGREKLSVLSTALTQYQEKRQNFLASSHSAALSMNEAQAIGLDSVAEKLAARQTSVAADLVAPLLSLSLKTEQAAFYVQAFIHKPDASSLNKYNEIKEGLSPLISQLRSLADTSLGAFLADIEQKTTSGTALLNKYLQSVQVEKRASDEMTTAAGKLNQSITDLAFFQSELAQKYMNTALWQIGFATLACITLSLLIAWRMTRSITVPLRETLSSAQRIADGDLTAEITSSRSDELGELMTAMGAMNQSLRNIISRVRDGVNNVARASSEIAAGNTDLSSRTEQQSAAVVETAASMEELTSTVKLNAENAPLRQPAGHGCVTQCQPRRGHHQ